MKRIFKRIAAIAMSAMMVAALAAPSFAAGSNYTAVNGDVIKGEKYLVMDSQATTPAVTFNFTAAPGTAIAAASGKLAVRAGNDAAVSGSPVLGVAAFTANQTTYDAVQTLPSDTNTQTETQANDPVTLESGQSYARSAFTIDFSGVSFSEPGVYRWIITESANAAAAAMGITNDANATRVLDVYVVDDSHEATLVSRYQYNGTNYDTEEDAINAGGVLNDTIEKVDVPVPASTGLAIEGYVLHNDADFQPNATGTAAEASGGKALGYVNEYETEDLMISKTVVGNQGSKDQYFKFTVTIEEAGAGTVIPVDLSNADATTLVNAVSPTAHTNPASVTANASGSVTQEFWMQHGQSITLQGLPKNASYTIVEDNGDYAVTTSTREGAVGQVAAVAGSSNTVTDADITADTTVEYTNTRTGIIPTGVILAVAPFAGIVALGGVGVTAIIAKNRKKDEDEA